MFLLLIVNRPFKPFKQLVLEREREGCVCGGGGGGVIEYLSENNLHADVQNAIVLIDTYCNASLNSYLNLTLLLVKVTLYVSDGTAVYPRQPASPGQQFVNEELRGPRSPGIIQSRWWQSRAGCDMQITTAPQGLEKHTTTASRKQQRWLDLWA